MTESPVHNNRKSFSDFIDEKSKDEAPSFHHLSSEQVNVPLSRRIKSFTPEGSPIHHHGAMHSPDISPLAPRSPESRWSFSPPCSPPRPSLLYRCISSLRSDGSIYSIAVSKGVVFTGSSSTFIRAWHPLDCCEKGYIQASCGKVRTMLSHGDMLFTSHKDHKVRVWGIVANDNANKFNPRKITTLPRSSPLRFLISRTSALRHKDIVSCMAYYHAEGILYTGSWDKTVKAWKLSDRKCIDSFAAHANNINGMVINQDGYLFTCSSDGTVKMWSKVCGENFHTLTMTLFFHPCPIYALALTSALPSQRSCLYSGSSDGRINFWEQQVSGRYNHGGSIQAHSFAVVCLATLENLVISGSEDAMIKIWKRSEGKVQHECVAVLEGHKGPVKCLGTCLEKENIVLGFLVFSASADRTFKVWRVKLLPEMKRSNRFDSDDEDGMNGVKGNDFNLGPALSPSWMEKKKVHGGSSVI